MRLRPSARGPDPALARRMGEAGPACAEAEFRAATMVERFAALYEEIARAKGLDVRPPG